MKLNKTIGRVATTLVATAMLASLAAVPAFAANTGNDGTVVTKLFTAKLNMENAVGAGVPNVTFEYVITTGPEASTLTSATGQELEILQGQVTGDLKTSVAFSATDKGTEYDSDDEDQTADDGYSKTVTVKFPENTFTAPGVYRFNLQQSSFNYVGVAAADVTDYYLEDNEVDTTKPLIITNTQLDSKDATPKYDGTSVNYGNWGEGKFADIENTFTTYAVTITKQVGGDMGDKNKDFVFDIDVNDPNTSKDVLSSVTVDGSASNFSTEGETKGSVHIDKTLKHGNSVTISGIPTGTTLDIDETNADDYIISYAEKENDGKVTFAADTDNDDSTTVATVTGNGEIIVTNTRNAVTPTGIVMNVAPYALLVVIAAAGCFVFLRKRRED